MPEIVKNQSIATAVTRTTGKDFNWKTIKVAMYKQHFKLENFWVYLLPNDFFQGP